jgi:hypothetical protein
VIEWGPDRSVHPDVSTIRSEVTGTRDAVAVLLITNVDEIDHLEAAVRAADERAAVVRWRSAKDNPALGDTARDITGRHRQQEAARSTRSNPHSGDKLSARSRGEKAPRRTAHRIGRPPVTATLAPEM